MTMDTTTVEGEVRETLDALIHAVMKGDLPTYESLVSDELTCFEPESAGCLVRGTALHRFFLRHETPVEIYHFEIVDPVIQVHGDTALTAYSLMMVQPHGDGFRTGTENVTRTFRRFNGQWKMIHFHRSTPMP